MKMCQPHWDKLRSAIDTRGLGHLIARSYEQLAVDVQAQLNGTATAANYDPLQACNWNIMGTALKMGGLYLMTGDYCPICEVVKHMAGKPDQTGTVLTGEALEAEWINGPADAELDRARDLGLVAGVQ